RVAIYRSFKTFGLIMFKELAYKVSGNAIDVLTGNRKKQSLSVLIYHQVLSEQDYLRQGEVTVDAFEWQMKLLANHFVPLPLAEALELLKEKQLPKNAVCVTFDDG